METFGKGGKGGSTRKKQKLVPVFNINATAGNGKSDYGISMLIICLGILSITSHIPHLYRHSLYFVNI
jgi:hypothetical protein